MMRSCHHRPVWLSTMKIRANPRSASRKTKRWRRIRDGSGSGVTWLCSSVVAVASPFAMRHPPFHEDGRS